MGIVLLSPKRKLKSHFGRRLLRGIRNHMRRRAHSESFGVIFGMALIIANGKYLNETSGSGRLLLKRQQIVNQL